MSELPPFPSQRLSITVWCSSSVQTRTRSIEIRPNVLLRVTKDVREKKLFLPDAEHYGYINFCKKEKKQNKYDKSKLVYLYDTPNKTEREIIKKKRKKMQTKKKTKLT